MHQRWISRRQTVLSNPQKAWRLQAFLRVRRVDMDEEPHL